MSATNYQLIELIRTLKKKAIEDNVGLWKRIASDLEKPTRQRRIVNLSSLNKFAKDNELIIVPGKVLGDGQIDKKVSIAAFSFSDSAKEKLLASQSQIMTIEELIKKNPKAADVRIIG